MTAIVLAWLHVLCPGPCNTQCIYSRLAMSYWSVVKILPYLSLPTYYSIILPYPRVQPYHLIYMHTRPYMIIALYFQMHFTYRISWITPSRRVTTCSLCTRYDTNPGALSASVKRRDMSIKWRLMVTEKMVYGLQRPIGLRCMATTMNKKVSRFDSSRLLKQWGLKRTSNLG